MHVSHTSQHTINSVFDCGTNISTRIGVSKFPITPRYHLETQSTVNTTIKCDGLVCCETVCRPCTLYAYLIIVRQVCVTTSYYSSVVSHVDCTRSGYQLIDCRWVNTTSY